MEMKGPPPIECLHGRSASTLIEAYFEINQLKHLFRQGWLRMNVPQETCETVAEHTLGVALLAMWLADGWLPELDAAKTIRMALIHDLGEAYAGDITPNHGMRKDEKARLEREGIERILHKLPAGERYVALWEEYEADETAEARLVRSIDRLEMALQAVVYHHRDGMDPSEFFASASRYLAEEPFASWLSELRDLCSKDKSR